MKLKRIKGGAVVEFAIILPILLMVLFGIIEFSLALYDQAVITNASREGARAGIVLKSPKLTNAQIETITRDYCENYLINLGAVAHSPTNPTITVLQSNPPDFSTPLNVNVVYNYSGLGLGKMLSALGSPLQLSATSVMKNE